MLVFCYILEMGIPEYDSSTVYYTNSIVQYNGLLYQSTTDANTGNTPSAGSSYWGTGNLGNPSGTVIMIAMSTPPTGYFLCNGQAVSRTTYSVLYGLIGTTYGLGDGSTTFNVPDFRGVFPKGAGTTSRTLGKDASGNFYAGTLGTYSTDQFQGHIHTQPADSNGSGGSVVHCDNSTNLGRNNLSGNAPASDGTNGTPRTGHTTEPQSLGINFIIKY